MPSKILQGKRGVLTDAKEKAFYIRKNESKNMLGVSNHTQGAFIILIWAERRALRDFNNMGYIWLDGNWL